MSDPIREERERLRQTQVETIMPLIGPLLDAWSNAPLDLRDEISDDAPELARILDEIDAATEGGSDPNLDLRREFERGRGSV